MLSSYVDIQKYPVWERLATKHLPSSFDLEVTARCNNSCRHCYINVPANNRVAEMAELDLGEILDIAGQAADLGALWCLITGGEPLLRDDLLDIYLGLKRLGLLVSLFTNACAVTREHVEVFMEYPPRDIEISVYGATKQTYENVTRRRGSWDEFNRGLSLLLDAGVKLRFKAIAMRSNIHEFEDIARFCRERTKDYYRFDSVLHLRYDGDSKRNQGIKRERLTAREIVGLEKADPERFNALRTACVQGDLVYPRRGGEAGSRLFYCGLGVSSFTVGYDGTFRLCGSLCHPDTTYDLRRGTVREAWEEWVPKVRDFRSDSPTFLEKCARCPIINLCLWCPAHAALETGDLDEWVEYFCEVAHARAAALQIEGYGPE